MLYPIVQIDAAGNEQEVGFITGINFFDAYHNFSHLKDQNEYKSCFVKDDERKSIRVDYESKYPIEVAGDER